jgi:hypothetical protein
MGRGILSAVKTVFPGIPDFICHFHFLRDIGKDLFETEYATIRNRLTLQRYLSNFKFEILLKVCHTTKQPLKKEAGHVTHYAMRRIPLSSPKV